MQWEPTEKSNFIARTYIHATPQHGLNDQASTYLSKPKSRHLYLHLTIASLSILSQARQALLPSTCLHGTLPSVRL